MQRCSRRKLGIRVCTALVIFSCLLATSMARGETSVSGKVITSDGKIVTSGVVALEKGELHNSAFISGGEILQDGTFKIPLPSGGPWGLHVYSEGYLYFPLQIQVTEGVDNEVPAILPVDGSKDDDPRISNIRFLQESAQRVRITMRVDDPDGNLGPQMLAIDRKRFKSYRMIPEKNDLMDKKANFPPGKYVSPLISGIRKDEDLSNWLFVVADHRCSNGPVYNGRNQNIYRQPIALEDPLRCEVPGIWKSNFGKMYSFNLESPGTLKGEQLEGEIQIDRVTEEGGNLKMEFRFGGRKGEAGLRLDCTDNTVTLKGGFALPGRTGEWVFTKLKNAKAAPVGEDLFMANCNLCHFHDSTDEKLGPGLKGVFKSARLPYSGKPPNEETIRTRIRNGGDQMPPFGKLTDDEISAIIDFLKGL